jgi:uncharacterized CHY-type Zn-finger protein
MPAEITQSNGHVAEVRFTCDHCHALVGTRLMLKKEAEAQTKKKVICRQCKQT